MRITMHRAALVVAVSTVFCIVWARQMVRSPESLLDKLIQPSAAAAPRSSLLPFPAPRAGRKFALLVGINNYKYPDRIPSLAGSLNDVEEMRQLLIEKFEFPPENILTLKDSEATHAAIISQLQTQLIARAQPGDIIVFHYSGHGSQMKDVTGQMNNGMDETIVPWDSRDPAGKVFDISGAELHPLLQQLATKTNNVTFVLDSCHSGTLVRGARTRGLRADVRTPPPLPGYAIAATRGLGAANDAAPRFATIAAATSIETAFEHTADGKDHGALTYFLVRQLRSAKAGVTYRDIMDNVAGDVTAYYPSQHVSLEGAEADQFVFGDGSSLARAYVTASPSRLTSNTVTLTVGQVQGAAVGSTYDVYPPGSKRFAPPEKPLDRVRLASVSDFTSEATVVSGGPILPASRAVEREHQYGKSRMRVFLDRPESSEALQSIRKALQPLTYIELVQAPSACNLQLKEDDGKVHTLGADETKLSPPVEAGDPDVVNKVVSQVKSWAKWFNVLAISSPHSEIELHFSLAASQTRDPMARVGKPDLGVWEGETVDATLTNDSDRDVYVAILDLSSDGSVSVIYPTEPGAMEVLKLGNKQVETFTTFVPKERSRVTDILKVFASDQPIDLRPLTQGTIRDIGDQPSNPLQAMLADSSDGTRGLAPVLTKPVDLGSWATVQRVLVVKHR